MSVEKINCPKCGQEILRVSVDKSNTHALYINAKPNAEGRWAIKDGMLVRGAQGEDKFLSHWRTCKKFDQS